DPAGAGVSTPSFRRSSGTSRGDRAWKSDAFHRVSDLPEGDGRRLHRGERDIRPKPDSRRTRVGEPPGMDVEVRGEEFLLWTARERGQGHLRARLQDTA